MEYRKINYLEKPISRIVLGCDTIHFKGGENLDDFLDGIYSLGINVFDTAHKYGLSEVSIGNWLSRRNFRDKVVIISKGCHPLEDKKSRLNVAVLREELEESFKRLRTDYIDIYFLHRDDRNADLKGLLSVLDEYKRKGKIGIYGGSNWSYMRIKEVNRIAQENGYSPFLASSPNYSLAEWENDPWGGGEGCVSLNAKGDRKEFEFYKDTKFPAFTYSSLARGFLTGRIKTSSLNEDKKYLDLSSVISYWSKDNIVRLKRAEELADKKKCLVSQIALAYVLNQPINAFPIIGTTSVERMKSNIVALDIRLSDEEIDYLSCRK